MRAVVDGYAVAVGVLMAGWWAISLGHGAWQRAVLGVLTVVALAALLW